jgi:uncharacterized protein (TIGR00369 family)
MSLSQHDLDTRREMARTFFKVIPHSMVLGLEVLSVEPGLVIARLPYRPEIVGNPYSGQIHGGAIITLIDQTSGAAAVCALPKPEAVATLDLRVDHMRAATAGQDVLARAECYRVTRDIAFVRCVCYQDGAEDSIATSMSTFMRTGRASMVVPQ